MCAHLFLILALASMVGSQTVEERARAFLQKFDENASSLVYQYSLASWAYNTDISQENADKESEAYEIWSKFYATTSEESNAYPVEEISDPEIKMQLQKLQDKGSGALSPEKASELRRVMSEMSTIYNTAVVCKKDNPTDCQTLEPGLESIMADSIDYEERLHVWEGWRVATGMKMRPLYEKYVDLKNEAARLNNFEDHGDYWRGDYETIDEPKYTYSREQVMEDARRIYNEILPLYKELHAYVRGNLQEVYPGRIASDACLPAHLLGDMWGRFWTNLYPLMIPYPDKPDIDVSSAMVEQGWDEMRLFKEAEQFFMSVNMSAMFDNFWNESMFVKPEGKNVVCHATAWDMGNREDFRIKMCTKVNMDDFLTVHHEMGHNQYQMAYRHHPYLLRDGANEGFHEAVGEIMSLSAATPSHLQALGLLPSDFKEEYETEINFLLKQALTIVGTLPFTYMLEEWRWQVFKEKIPKDEWMLRWWQMKRELVGVMEAVPRDERYCDPPALFHVSGDFSFIRYFTRTIYQFQFQEALCKAAGHTGTLKIDSQPLLQYFSTLMVWLKEENQKNNRVPGWNVHENPSSENAFKVRISLKSALGDDAYTWNSNEMYLFKSTMAFAMRQYYLEEKGTDIEFTAENVITYNETERISFYFVVMHPTKQVIPKTDVEAAIWLSRERINSAFLLDDDTLEFVGLVATLAPPKEEKITIWLVVFGVVMGITVCAGIFLVTTGIISRKKKAKKAKEAPLENPYDVIEDGEVNKAFEEDDEQTGF
ncbi:hypothetical protein DNTS_025838 [Danionella cerebrum]|uniref:Angiotensin-converting enzyme n=1 Tax=Danionella cerebrum TaxID=2873325 RepID=A0A553NA24_9TELE|nr:hypothetical protein DNTS_025838 [Danionella translucida]